MTISIRNEYQKNIWYFQHIAKFINVTTIGLFIVTAAVYRGFDQVLCLIGANTIN